MQPAHKKKPKMINRKLRSGVNRTGAFKQKVFCIGVPTNYIFLLRNLIKCIGKIDPV